MRGDSPVLSMQSIQYAQTIAVCREKLFLYLRAFRIRHAAYAKAAHLSVCLSGRTRLPQVFSNLLLGHLHHLQASILANSRGS